MTTLINEVINKNAFSLTERNEKTIKYLANFNNKTEVQAELIRAYLSSKDYDIEIIENELITNLLTNSNDEIFNYLVKLNRKWSLKDLELIFYSFLDRSTINNNGIIFTPSTVSDYITNQMINSIDVPDKLICDFSCGGGEFLISALKQLKLKFPTTPAIHFIENNLFGVDILSENVYSTKLLLSLQALEYKEDKEIIDFNIIQGDSTSSNILTNFNKLKKSEGFDFIVGNPPYVKFQELSLQQRKSLKESYTTCDSGNFNLFYAFIELSFNYLKEDGKIGYIIPNHLLKMQSAKSLRNFLLGEKLINKVIDFKDNQLFENAQTYSAIIFFDKKPKEEIVYKTVDKKINNGQIVQHLNDSNYQAIAYNHLNADSIHLLSKEDYLNIKSIENQKNNLRIMTGIATQKDSLYLINTTKEFNKNEQDKYFYKEFENEIYKIEKDITISIIKGSGEKKVDEATNFYEFNRIIYPYQLSDDKVVVISEKEMIQKYPETFKYFQVIRGELSKRNGGKPSVKVWYEYGRSQALNSFTPKIIFPTNSAKPNFTYFKDYALFNNGYAIFGTTSKNEIDLDILTKVLNSVVVEYYIKHTSYMISGGYYCYQKKYLSNFTIPDFSEEDMIFLKKSTSKEDINEFLIRKYNLLM
ncbi:N-6 DNA methylase [Sporosarcina sp. P26b]|uniref:Eco57I restriction-modification methylase domain-containing protein n=1 Tax=Sporosarcina sp. P26b TaxID=2048253 RepID=UPI001304270E|nr:N-6 DNA methylase [Sporosarcina sp. P26b]